MTCFSAWSDMIFKDGFWNFYHSVLLRITARIYGNAVGIGALRSILIWMLQREPEDVSLS